MADHTIVFQVWYDGQWNDVPTNNRSEITITEGRQDQLSRVTTTTLSGVEINNRDGVYSPRNPGSPLHGKIGRNTRCRLLVDGDVEFEGEIESWPQRWSPGGTDVWVPIVAHGIMYRLGLPGQKALARSAIRRFCDPTIATRMNRIVPRSYWPIDHGEPSATDQAAALLGSEPLVLEYAAGEATAHWSAADLAPWLGRGLQVDGSMVLTGPAPSGAAVTEAVAADVVLRNGLPGGTTAALGLRLFETATAGGDLYHYILIGSLSSFSTGLFLYRENTDDLSITPFGAGTTDQADALWDNRLRHLRVMAVQNGSDVDVSAYLDGELVVSGTHNSATLGVPDWQMVMTGQPRAALGHAMLWAGDAAVIPPAADVWDAVQGHAGEQTHARIERICAEEGIPLVLVGGELRSEQCGPQPLDTVLEVLFDAADTDGGILAEPRGQWGLWYRTYRDLVGQRPAATLTYGQREIGGPLEPSEDLDLVANDVTVRNRTTGAEARAVQESGPLNVQESVDDPEGVGRLAVEYELGLADDDRRLPIRARRLLRLGTWPDARYPVIPVDIDALAAQGKTSLVADLVGLRLGDRLTITNPPAWAQAGPIDQMVQGTTRTASLSRRRIELNAIPAGPYLGLLYDTFDRTVSGAWGTPDIGPGWVTVDNSGGAPSVAGGYGVHPGSTVDPTDVRAGDLDISDVQVYVREVSPAATPSGGQNRAQIHMRVSGSDEVFIRLLWNTNGTLQIDAGDSDADDIFPDTAVPGVTASQPVDVLIRLVGDTLRVWAALSSVGIDTSSPALNSATTTILGSGSVVVRTDPASGMSTPLAMRYGEISIAEI